MSREGREYREQDDSYSPAVFEENDFEFEPIYSVSAPPGDIEYRVFIGGLYALMPIIREIEEAVFAVDYQPVVARDYIMRRDQTREYSRRLLRQCKFAIFETTIAGGWIAEAEVAVSDEDIIVLHVYMASNEKKEFPRTMSSMDVQRPPLPQGYITIKELHEIVQTFLRQF